MICERLKYSFVEGEEIHGRKDNVVCPCKVLEISTNNGSCSYKVGWLDGNREVMSTSLEDSNILIRKKLPFTKDLLKLFIRESTSQNEPWVVHHNLAMEHGISTLVPDELIEKIIDEQYVSEELRNNNRGGRNKRARMINDNTANSKKTKTDQVKQEKIIKYPIDDFLVMPSGDDPIFCQRPIPCTNFMIPMDTVGDLFMVWDFCSSFARLLYLSPFSLEDFENSLVYEGTSNLILEVHSAILRLLIDDQGEYYALTQQEDRSKMVNSTNWVEYLCDLLELEMGSNATNHISRIKRGQYHKLTVHEKLEILCALVHMALSTDSIRGKLGEYFAGMMELKAAKRKEDLEELQKRKEEQLKVKAFDNNKNPQENDSSELTDIQVLDLTHNQGDTKDMFPDDNMKESALDETSHSGQRSKRDILASRRAMMKQTLETKIALDKEKEASRMVELQKRREENRARAKEASERKLKEQREEQFDRAMEKCFIRTDALGKDRNHNRYWFFKREGRIFIEDADYRQWGFYASKEELDGLIASLNPKGVRELNLQGKLQKQYSKICAALHKRSKEMAQKVVIDSPVLRRSVRVSALPKENKTPSFLSYVNKWKR